jgi:hypothetical protein
LGKGQHKVRKRRVPYIEDVYVEVESLTLPDSASIKVGGPEHEGTRPVC